MITLNLKNIQKFLEDQKYEVQFQKETNQLYILLKIEEYDFPLFIRIYEDGDLMQFILFIPCNIVPGTENDVARLLHTLNKEIDVPGFGMDETAKVTFYRIMIPALNKQIEEQLILTFIKSLPLIGETFTPVIATAATGRATYGEIMHKMKEIQEKDPKKARR